MPANKQADPALPFDNSYARLPSRFYSRLDPSPVAQPRLIRVNHDLARYLGIDPQWLESGAGVKAMAGNHILAGSEPIATVYAGHQFGSWNPQLGDGRAILLGELVATDGVRHDLQLKGSGRTPYSRGGDGRSPLGPVLREYLVSEAMVTLGIPGTRALAAISTGEQVYREGALPGAILARVAQSHIRIGTFQFFASKRDNEALGLLAEHVIQRHYPDATQADNPSLALLDAVVARQASLIAKWQLAGFIHGVMNTDNVLVTGETIDYGPCAFMDTFHPQTVFSSIDHGGRYAYQNQPGIAHWNLANFAQALLPLLDPDQERALGMAQASVDDFPGLYSAAYQAGICRKLGLNAHQPGDDNLVNDWFELLAEHRIDFTLAFRRLTELVAPSRLDEAATVSFFQLPAAFDGWLQRWQQRLAMEPRHASERQTIMLRSNPVFIPRNHLVEAAIEAATINDDLEPFHRLVEVLADPYHYDPAKQRFATPPTPSQVVEHTFCGT